MVTVTAQQTITYEHPLNERIRTFLRGEQLFELANYRFNHLASTWDAKECIATIIELYNLIERTEFRNELLKELERHVNALERLGETPTVDHQALQKILHELEKSSEALRSAHKQGYFPKDNELLIGLRQRLIIPGGTCSFDLPAFHYWLHLSPKNRQFHLTQWLNALQPLEKSLALVLGLTRQSSLSTRETATAGSFQKSLSTQTVCQLLRLSLRSDVNVFPEISANKHRVNVRFLQANFEQKTVLANQDVLFELTCCMI